MQALVAHWVAVLVDAPAARSPRPPGCCSRSCWPSPTSALVPAPDARRADARRAGAGAAPLRRARRRRRCWSGRPSRSAGSCSRRSPGCRCRSDCFDAATAALAFRAASGAFVGLVALSVAWGFSFGQARVARTRVRVEMPGLGARLAGLRVVQISDLHIGNGLEGERLARMVERTNALEPDLIVITGDIFDFDPRSSTTACGGSPRCARAAASTRSSATTTSTPEPSAWSPASPRCAPGDPAAARRDREAAAAGAASISRASRIRGRTGRRAGSSCPRSSALRRRAAGRRPHPAARAPARGVSAGRAPRLPARARRPHARRPARAAAARRALEPGADRHALHARALPAAAARRST